MKTLNLLGGLALLCLFFACTPQSKLTEEEATDNGQMYPSPLPEEEVMTTSPSKPGQKTASAPYKKSISRERMHLQQMSLGEAQNAPMTIMQDVEGAEYDFSDADIDYEDTPRDFNTESYERIYENQFLSPLFEPLSTFGIDVDVASYANVRRFLNRSQMPYKGAVRIEEMINYFDYDFEQPKGERPFAVHTELGDCPWNAEHHLLQIGLQGKEIATEALPASNLVFLLDVSGSMENPDKLPLLKSAYKLLVDKLRPEDRVAIVVYAGAAGVVLPSTPATEKQKILTAIEQLSAGGSTAGGQGIELAYKIAKEHMIEGGNNRVILATDGDFNVGVSNNSELVRMIEEKRELGIFLSVLGFGTGNYKDDRMEQLADKGNGNYAYIDNILEAKKVLVTEFGGTLFTIAKDVKMQIEFNPAKVKGYRLIGYENRVLAAQDFKDDRKDAGDLGSGHTVTALYEIIPAGAKTELKLPDSLKYQLPVPSNVSTESEWLTLKLRYKKPDASTSTESSEVLTGKVKTLDKTSENFRFAASVAGFGMLLRDSAFKGANTYESVLTLAKAAKGEDDKGYRAEMIQLVEKALLLNGAALLSKDE